MEEKKLSPSSIEEEQLIKAVSYMVNSLTQRSNERLKKFQETSHNAEFNPYDEDGSLEEPEARSLVCATGENSASNISLTVGGENLRTPQSTISFASTDVTCGSSSSNVKSSEDESLDDLEDIERELERVWYLDDPLSGLPRGAVKHILNPPSSTSGTNLDNKSQTAFTRAKEPSFQNDSNSLKLPDVCNSLDAPALRPERRPSKHIKAEKSSFQEESKSLKLPDVCNNLDAPGLRLKRRPSKHIEGEESSSKKPLSSTLSCFSNKEVLFTLEDVITAPPLVRNTSSLIPTDDEEPENFPESCVRVFFADLKRIRENYQKEDGSVRKKVKRVPPVSSRTNSHPTSSSASSISGSSRKDGCSLLQSSKSLKHTSPEEDDWNIYESGEVGTESPTSSETHYFESLSPDLISRSVRNVGHSLMQISKSLEETLPAWGMLESISMSDEVKYFPQKPWEKELMSFCRQTEKAATTPRLDTESLLKDLNNFFQNNRVDADQNLSMKERKDRIITSKYFSDEFCRRHGLLSQNEVLNQRSKEFERYTSPYHSHELDVLEVCKILTERGVTEEEFVEYFNTRICLIKIKGCESVSGPSNGDRNHYVHREFDSIRNEYKFSVILDIYRKLTREGATFLSILLGSKIPSALVERNLRRDLLVIAENSSQDSSDQSPKSAAASKDCTKRRDG